MELKKHRQSKIDINDFFTPHYNSQNSLYNKRAISDKHVR